MNAKKLILLIVVAIILIFLLILALKFYFELRNYRKQIENIQINDVDLMNIKDGVYQGSYKTALVSVKVEVTVKDHKIINIKILEHLNGQGKRAEVIVEKVINEQKLKVDVISGATASSKVILKAIENALSK